MLKPALFLFLCSISLPSHASVGTDSGSIAWVAASCALVFFMQAGFALIESGASRAKNAVNVMMKNYLDVCTGSLMFWCVGYGLMFGLNPTGLFGTTDFFLAAPENETALFFLFQMLFAATATTICSGAMAERTQFFSYLIAATVITGVIYPVFGSWVWNSNGWLAERGFIDFAGSTVVHSVGAWCALAGILILGPRTGRFNSEGKPHHIPGHNASSVALGGFILWLGWFGFNGGSLLESGVELGHILLNTHLAATAAVFSAVLFSRLLGLPILVSTAVNGSLAGLVAITAGCATMNTAFAVFTGAVGGLVYVASSELLLKLQIDDVVGAIPVHGFAGAWGTLAAGMFITGDLFNLNQIMVQLLGVAAAFAFAFSMALVLFYLIHVFVGLRSSLGHEQQGLDYTEHDEIGYPEFQRSLTFKPKG